MFDERVAWYSQVASKHPALAPAEQSKVLTYLMNSIVRLQCWQGQSWPEYLRDCRHALQDCRHGATPIWRTAQDTYAWWLDETERDARKHPSLKRRWSRVKRLRERILLHNQRMVIRQAHKKVPQGMEYSDLIMEGNMGLMRAVDLFDPRKNYRFSTYAHFWIDQSIALALKQKGFTVRTPLSALNKAWQAQRDAKEAGDERTISYPGQREALSLDDPGLNLHMEDEQSTHSQARVDAKRLVAQLTRDLPERLSQVIALRYGIEQRDAAGYREIADQLGVSRERARQLEQEALKRLRDDQSDSATP